MVKELAFVAYYVRDMARARRFYGETLGLRPGELCNDDWIEFDLGNATFALDGSGEALGIVPGSSSLLKAARKRRTCTSFRHVGRASSATPREIVLPFTSERKHSPEEGSV